MNLLGTRGFFCGLKLSGSSPDASGSPSAQLESFSDNEELFLFSSILKLIFVSYLF